MDSSWLVAFVGTLVGAGVSLAGTVWVHRREVIRGARIRMLVDLVPAFLATIGPQSLHREEYAGSQEALDALSRWASVAGDQEVELVVRLRRRMDHLTRPRTEEEGPKVVMSPDGMPLGMRGRPDDEAAAEEALRDLEQHLARKIR